MSYDEVERAAQAAKVALSEFDRAGVTTVMQTVPALAQTLRELLDAVTASTPPAEDIREAMVRELHPDYPSSIPALNQLYEDHAERLFERFEVRLRGPVTDAEIDAAMATLDPRGLGGRNGMRDALKAAREVRS